MSHRSIVQALLTSIAAVAIGASSARAVPFDYDFQRFTATGNQYGSLVDEFDDGSLAGWTLIRGTAVESGGVLTLRDPGEPVTFNFPDFSWVSETSTVRNNTLVYDGFGDFLLETVISQKLAPENQFAGMGFNFGGSSSIGLVYSNWAADVAAEAGIAPGLAMSFSLSEGASAGVDWVNVGSYLSDQSYFTAGDVTGDIWLRIAFADDTNEFTGSYSIDGGSTFTTISSYQTGGGWGGLATLAADPRETLPVPEPSTGLLVGMGLLGLMTRTRCRS